MGRQVLRLRVRIGERATVEAASHAVQVAGGIDRLVGREGHGHGVRVVALEVLEPDVLAHLQIGCVCQLAAFHLLLGHLCGTRLALLAIGIHVVAVHAFGVRVVGVVVASQGACVALKVVGLKVSRHDTVDDVDWVGTPSHDAVTIVRACLGIGHVARVDTILDCAACGTGASADARDGSVTAVGGSDIGRRPDVLDRAAEDFAADDSHAIVSCCQMAAHMQVLHRAAQGAEQTIVGTRRCQVDLDGVELPVEGACIGIARSILRNGRSGIFGDVGRQYGVEGQIALAHGLGKVLQILGRANLGHPVHDGQLVHRSVLSPGCKAACHRNQ